ncbi:hypothetical protein ILP92_17025 [Maribius pontilimi]|uniref:Phage protein D n=1 Tax=Palleronia pontilimi TaxID=1964209 RepID=A0A934IK50_9RHOB|nr:hypothetical protein [Palleronia pontilimi]MBJ3764441.1 hypothetical protein [Palleronia pontilimi]
MDSDLHSPEGAAPGTAFFAPQVRLVTPEGTAVEIDGKPIAPDIVSATVTLPVSGVGQLEVVLNNQRHDTNNRPVYPPWRYNKLEALSFGKRVRLDMRYGAEGWTPMILARITDLVFLYPSASGAQMTLKGEDLASLLKVKPTENIVHPNRHEMDMVEAEISAAGAGLTVVGPTPRNTFSEPLATLTHEQAKTHLEFIQSLATRMDFEVFMAFDNPDPGTAAPNPTEPDARSVSFHFVPARSGTLEDMVTLQWGRDIVEFAPAFKVWDILTGATAGGSVPRGRGSFTATVTAADAINDLHPAPGGPTPINAATARENAFDEENRPQENVEQISVSNIDEERARRQAEAKVRASARQFLTAELTTIGFTRLRPGIHVNLEGLYPPFDGIYYVNQTVHSLTAAGYITKTSLRRPGMLDASGYPAAG